MQTSGAVAIAPDPSGWRLWLITSLLVWTSCVLDGAQGQIHGRNGPFDRVTQLLQRQQESKRGATLDLAQTQLMIDTLLQRVDCYSATNPEVCDWCIPAETLFKIVGVDPVNGFLNEASFGPASVVLLYYIHSPHHTCSITPSTAAGTNDSFAYRDYLLALSGINSSTDPAPRLGTRLSFGRGAIFSEAKLDLLIESINNTYIPTSTFQCFDAHTLIKAADTPNERDITQAGLELLGAHFISSLLHGHCIGEGTLVPPTYFVDSIFDTYGTNYIIAPAGFKRLLRDFELGVVEGESAAGTETDTHGHNHGPNTGSTRGSPNSGSHAGHGHGSRTHDPSNRRNRTTLSRTTVPPTADYHSGHGHGDHGHNHDTAQGPRQPSQGQGARYPTYQGRTYPRQGGNYPRQSPNYPAQGASYPGQGANYPRQGANYPTQGANYPRQGASYPAQGGGYPAQGGGYPSQGGNYPRQGANYPRQGGNYPTQGRTYPTQAGNYPVQGSYYPARGAYQSVIGYNQRVRRQTTDVDGHGHANETHQQCLSGEQLFDIFGINEALGISEAQFNELCPALLHQLMTDACHQDNDLPQPRPLTTLEVYGWGTLAVFIITVTSIFAILILPCLGKKAREYLIHTFVALSVGTMSGDALLHLIPEALGLHTHGEGAAPAGGANHDHAAHNDHARGEGFITVEIDTLDVLYKMAVVLCAIYFFFLFESLMNSLFSTKAHTDSETRRCSRLVEDPECEKNSIFNHQSEHIMLTSQADHHLLPNLPEPSTLTPLNMNGNNDMDDCRGIEGLVDFGKEEDEEEVKPSFLMRGLTPVSIMVLLGDSLHNTLDGLVIGAAFTANIFIGVSTSIAVLCHEIPHELGDFGVLIDNGMSYGRAVFWNFASGCTAFVGLYLGILIGTRENAQQWLFAITAGFFLYISMVDLFGGMLRNDGDGHGHSHGVAPAMKRSPAIGSRHSWLQEMALNEQSERKSKIVTFICQNIGLLTGWSIMFIVSYYEEELLHLQFFLQ